MAEDTRKTLYTTQPGYRSIVTKPRKPVPDDGSRQPRRPEKDEKPTPNTEPLALFGPDDEFVAVARSNVVDVYRFDTFGDDRARPVARAKLGQLAERLIAGGRREPFSIYALDAKGRIHRCDFRGDGGDLDRGARFERLAPEIKAPIRQVVALRKRLILMTGTEGKLALWGLDRRSRQIAKLGRLALDLDLTALDADRHDILLGWSKGEVRLVLLGEDSVTNAPEVHAFEVERVTAATVLNGTHLVLAMKGGQVQKLDLRASAIPEVAARVADPLARLCYALRTLLKRCGCDCDCGRPDGGGSDGDGGGGPGDDEPCDDRHRAKLGFTVYRLARVGTHVVATARSGTRMAVLDARMNVLAERRLDRGGADLDTGRTHSQNMLIRMPRTGRVEVLELTDFVASLKPALPDGFSLVPMPKPKTVTYWGHTDAPAQANPVIKVCLFPVVDNGQTYGDANMTKLMAQIEAKAFDRINDYYDECSFGEAEYQFTTFGYDIGGARKPLVLPQPVADYWWDPYRGGGLRAVMPADWSDPVVFDGTEMLRIKTHPRAGAENEYDIPFAAMWTDRSFASYPVTIDFDGTETAELEVQTQTGDSHTLTLNFGALNLTLNQADDHAAFLDALAAHVTAAIRAAEGALPGDPVLIQDVVYRRERTSTNATEFGRLQGQFRAQAMGGASQKGRIAVTSATGATLTAIGLTPSGDTPGVMDSTGRVSDYISECLRAAQVDAGEGIGGTAAYFETTVGADFDGAAQEIDVTVSFTVNFGGQQAEMEVQSSSGLSGTGWNNAQPDPGSECHPNDSNALRHAIDLADDTFTAACQHIRDSGAWNRAVVAAMFSGFDVMMITHIGAPHAGIPAGDAWNCDDPTGFGSKRMYKRTHHATDKAPPGGEDPVQFGASAITGQNFTNIASADMNAATGVMAHELGHALGLPDLYSANGYRDDVLYVDRYAMMAGGNSNFHHFCGWSKWSLGWIPDDPDGNVNRTVFVDLPVPDDTLITDAWLVPVEFWDNAMRQDVRDTVGGSVEIGQLMKLNLGSDGGVTAFLELRARGDNFSQSLSPQPTIYATNGLDPDSDREWAVNGLYRRSAHRLNEGTELRNVGDVWDFASGPEFPIKGTIARVMEQVTVRGSIPVWRVRVEREQAEYIDLHFQDHVPSWKSPDIWVDWAGDNADPSVPREYPVGMPTDQGETVRFPSSGTERHYVVARVHNAGNSRAENVKVRWFVCDPPGAGDDGRWIDRGTRTIPVVQDGDNELAVFNWDVDSSINEHQCMRMEIIDWEIPDEIDPATGDTVALSSDDVKLQNNVAQQNVFDFEAYSGSPFDAITFPMQVHNDRNQTEIAALVPEGLRDGMKLTISPREWAIPKDEARVFTCTLELDHTVIRPGCDNDSGFLLTAWRRGGEADARWGSCFYHVRPRFKTRIELLQGYWVHGRLALNGLMQPLTDTALDLTEDMPLLARIRLQIDGPGGQVLWRAAQIAADGSFALDITQEQGKTVIAQAWFDRTDRLGSSVSNELTLKQAFIE
ncbi:hypothetical protein QO034_16150 [Sedimentitalea sp. JM2-8]|uniref:Peptidase M6-like domain-containing protein n=1 Tax=Sedimentitalea xiamensis TaxID=3050037 RepID=A0ABT7FHL3_9RHOB|nr:immune inhibitor A domain-containing protein [Sedimentitalea xiamensis]MDK3074626.1 hypothetical protein [Sedimentitalea xiamensis]